MPGETIYLSKKRNDFIKNHVNGGLAEYVRKKIDEDISKIPTVEYCDHQIQLWRNRKKMAKKREKR